MPRSAKRSRNAAGKSLGDMCAAQKALATDGSSVRGGQLHGRRAADTLLLGIGRSPRLLEDSAPARSGAERALSLRLRSWLTVAASRAGNEGRQTPRRSSESGTTQRWAKLAWFAEVNGWNYTNASEFNGTLDRDLESARYALLVKIKGEDYARNRQRLALTSMWTPGTRAI